MASLSHSNPHSKQNSTAPVGKTGGMSTIRKDSVVGRWMSCKGDAISNDSKKLLAVIVGGNEYVFADLRFLETNADGRMVFEAFFDGEIDALVASFPSKAVALTEFVRCVQEIVSFACLECFRQQIYKYAQDSDKAQLAAFRKTKQPDDTIRLGRETLEDSFRDAGCMLRFVAVRIAVTPECAACLGGIAFPTYFGLADAKKEEDDKIPKWIVGLGATTVVFGIATIYAWAQILIYGNPYKVEMNRSTGSSSGEALTSEMISNLTMTQLLYILQRIQQLAFHSPEHAKELLSQSPQLTLALIHAQYIVCGPAIDSRLLPLTPDEIKIVKERANQIRAAEGTMNISQEALIGVSSMGNQDVGLSRKFQAQQQMPNDQVSELTKLLTDLDPTMLSRVMDSVMGDKDILDLKSLVDALMNLSAEQITALPENVQRQVLKLLEDSMTT